MSWNCQQCGACCRAIKCPKLRWDNKCSVYDDRPLACRVDDMINLLGLEKNAGYVITDIMCDRLRKGL